MKKLCKMTVSWLLVLAMVFAAGCNGQPEPTTEPTVAPTTVATEPTEDTLQQDLTDMYLQAVEDWTSDGMGMEIRYQKNTTVGQQTYKEFGTTAVSYWGYGTDALLAKVQNAATYGATQYNVNVVEIFQGGTAYQTIDSYKFYAELSAEEFTARYAPAQLLDPALYTLSVDESGKSLTFANPAAGESWIVPEQAQLVQAAGTAELDDAGKLKSASYSVTYAYGAATVELQYNVTVTSAGREPVVPADTADYLLLDHVDSAYALEHAFGYLCQVKHVSANTRDLIISAALGGTISNDTDLDAYAVGDTYGVRWMTNYSVDEFATGQNTSQKMVELFKDGQYTVSEDDGRAQPNAAVTQGIMESAVVNHVSGNVQPSDYIASVVTTDVGSALLFEFTGNELMGEAYRDELCETLFGAANALDSIASGYETTKAEFYVALDKYSLLPTAIGYAYEGKHIVQGVEYVLSRQVDQALDLASLSAYEAIYEEPAPETQPEQGATPLFYRVTGANGQQMWLFGTIHVGDERTGFLPQEIYDALLASDALAIECDSDGFEDLLAQDAQLVERAAACYYYADGTTAKDHIVTPELYESALQAIKASGNYSYNSDYEKLHLWSSYLDNFYLQQGYLLSSEKGVESRLTKMAEEAEIPLREVESVIFQLEMMANYSEHLQEVLLFSSLTDDTLSNRESLAELYEAWCAGDEAALKELLKSESWDIAAEDIVLDDLTGEDLERAQAILADLDNINAQLEVLRHEYNKAMESDRNAGMLDVAKTYLESGETVFYAVGLAHLLAEDGLVNTLRAAGYTVEAVTYQ